MPHWPALESILIENINFHRTPTALNYLGSSIGTARFINVYSCVNELVPWLVDLPPTTRSLEIDALDLMRSRPAHQINTDARTLALARVLQKVVLVDRRELERQYVFKWERGALGGFIGSLDEVARLTTSPVALTDWSTLADRTMLQELVLLSGAAVPNDPVQPREPVELFERSSSLKHVTLSSEIAAEWSDEQKRAVELAAANKGIVLVRV